MRIISGVVMAIVALLGIFMLPNAWFSVILLALMLLGLHEWARLSGQALGAYLIAATVLCILAALVHFELAHTQWIMAFACWLWLMLAMTLGKPASSNWMALAMGVWILWAAWTGMRYLHEVSPAVLLLALLMVWIADSMAYFGGKRFGQTKLAPSISPGKTWEGVLSGVLAAVLVSIMYAATVLAEYNLNLIMIGLLAVAVALISVVGDLNESKLKRAVGMKDSGSLIPGHGGVLDRIDGLVAGVPLFAFCWPFLT